jgi:manganese/iron transport system permease protein
MLDFLAEPFQYAFMLRAAGAAVIVGIVCAVVGTYVVLRGMAFFGDALAHAILPGVATGYLISGGTRDVLFWWALLAALVSAFIIGAISRTTKIREDTAIGIIFSGMFALGITLISTVRNYSIDLSHFLFGDVLGVSNSDLLLTVVFGGVIILIIFAFYKEFLVTSFDPILAATLRLPVKFLDYLLMVLIAVTVVVSLQTVGVALMVAMLITPSATAYLLTNRLPLMILISAAIASFSGILGLYISYYAGVASGAAIVLSATVIFLITMLIRMLLTRNLQRTIQKTGVSSS